MTEEEWPRCADPERMLEALRNWDLGNHGHHPPRLLDRRLRLFSCACVRLGWANLTDERSRAGVVAAEAYADGEPSSAPNLSIAFGRSFAALQERPGDAWAAAAHACTYEAGNGLLERAWRQAAVGWPDQADGRRLMADALRDLVGDPYRPQAWPHTGFTACRDATNAPRSRCDVCGDVSASAAEEEAHRLGCCPYRTPTVAALAEAVYRERLPDGGLDLLRLAVLADALEERGCPPTLAATVKVNVLLHGDASGWHVSLTWPLPMEPAHTERRREKARRWAEDRYRVRLWTRHVRTESGAGEVRRETPNPVLAHLRDAGHRHWPGCWALDLVRGVLY